MPDHSEKIPHMVVIEITNTPKACALLKKHFGVDSQPVVEKALEAPIGPARQTRFLYFTPGKGLSATKPDGNWVDMTPMFEEMYKALTSDCIPWTPKSMVEVHPSGNSSHKSETGPAGLSQSDSANP